ncbi:DUF6147 family protein [Hespellia stercorisuis]|uniref:Uncharacterized protein n=1 Tax=Hespellia stercorisuis DSM 15480 TaxID=1121950 RepID=A0A1M6JEU5_9FIRM|nr:DUF6147 family protein [Hespellia stercorisuis]SHJ45223.1 hypothetical protein SAMN02745243_00617 [Hespellia stercorisuis DSM 15480]
MKRIISLLCAVAILGGITFVSGSKVIAADTDYVDGSYLTEQEESYGSSRNALTRGEFLSTGDCSISKAGRGRVYVYGSTTANSTVDYISVTMSVEQYNEKDNAWHQIDYWDTEKTNTYFVSTSKSIVVERGYYYRVHAMHYTKMNGVEGDFGDSVTDGIMIP